MRDLREVRLDQRAYRERDPRLSRRTATHREGFRTNIRRASQPLNGELRNPPALDPCTNPLQSQII